LFHSAMPKTTVTRLRKLRPVRVTPLKSNFLSFNPSIYPETKKPG